MADKQSLNATFFAFRKRERGGVLLGASLAYIVVALLIFGLFAVLNWKAVVDYFAWTASFATQGGYDPQNASPFGTMPASVLSLIPAYFLLTLVTYVLFAAYEAACLKWMIRGETGGVFGLSLGADTWRVWSGYWMWLVLLIAAYFVCAIIGMIFVGSIFAAAATDTPSNSGVVMGIAAVLVGLLVCCVLAFFCVRFAPASATSIARRRFAFFDAWTVTKGRFWALFGSFLLLSVMWMVGYMVLYGFAMFGVLGSIFAQMITAGGQVDQAQLMQMLSAPSVWVPLAIIYALMIVGTFVWLIAILGVNARAALAAIEEGKITVAAS